MYPLHQAQEDLLALLRPLALDASLLLLECAGTTHRKPPFGLTQARVGDRLVGVREEAVLATPFCTLRRFAKDFADPGTRVLVVALLSGHFATRFRGTLEALLP